MPSVLVAEHLLEGTYRYSGDFDFRFVDTGHYHLLRHVFDEHNPCLLSGLFGIMAAIESTARKSVTTNGRQFESVQYARISR